MKRSISKKLSLAFAGAVLSLACSFTAMAAVPEGTLEGADNTSVYGWVWDSDSYGHIIPVEISIYPADSSEILKSATVKADHYQDKLQESIGDGYHGFKWSIDWNQFEKEQLRVTAYAVTDEDRVFLGELTYNKAAEDFVLHTASQETAQAPSQASSTQGPGQPSQAKGPGQESQAADLSGQAPVSVSGQKNVPVSTEAPGRQSSSFTQASLPVQEKKPETQKSQAPDDTSDSGSQEVLLSWQRGPGVTPKKEEKPEHTSLGMFTVTGYCNCDICCPSTSKLTYSGTEPQPNHTISADINLFPMGTRLMIGDIIYTVEDIGSSVTEKKIDIFYATHEEAAAHGTTTEEVFAVSE